MTKITALARPKVKMTIRVYTVTREGIIIADSGTEQVRDSKWVPPKQDSYPACKCPRCVAGQAVAR
ncbi:hypothetical protein [Streptomyces sp. NPDC054940]